MKSKNEIEQLAFLEFPRVVNDPYNPMEDDNAYERQIWIDAYTKCQEGIKKELYQFGKLVLDTFHSEGKTNSGHERLARQKFDEWFNQQQEDMVGTTEDKLETELEAKKYTEEDMLNAINYCSSLTPRNSKLSPLERAVYAHNYIKSINKQR